MLTTDNTHQPTTSSITFKGFTVDLDLPSEGLMKRRFQDQEEIIDQITKELYILPKKFSSEFKTLRGKAYKILNLYTVPLHSFYFLPEGNAQYLIDDINALKPKYTELQNEIDKYLDEKENEWMNKVNNYIDLKPIKGMDRCPNLAGRVAIHILPISLSRDNYNSVSTAELSAKGLDEVGFILQNQYKQVIKKAVKEVDSKLGVILARLSSTIYKTTINEDRLKMAQQSLKDLHALAEGAGLDSILGHNMKTALALTEVLEIQAASKPDSDALRTSITTLATELGYDELDLNIDPRKALEGIALDLQKDTSPRVQALVAELI